MSPIRKGKVVEIEIRVMTMRVVLHVQPPSLGLPLLVVLVLAGLGAAILLGLGLATLVRRRSRSYLLVVLALAALFGRTVVAGASLGNALPAGEHHLVEHSLDVVMAAIVVGAVYYARTVEPERGDEVP